MKLICILMRALPPQVQHDLAMLCMAANMNGGTIRLKTSTITYDKHANALTVEGQEAVRFQLDEPKPQYRWN